MEPAALAQVTDKQAESAVFANTSVTQMPTSLQQVIAIAKVMAASGFYPEAKQAQQAAAIMLLGIQYGIPPAQALTAIHVVKGKPMLHYSAILSKIRQHPGYDYDIVESSAKRAEIVFLRIRKDGSETECGRSIFTAEDAKRQGTQNMDKFPDTMLLARAASNGVKRYCPDVLNGMPVYVHGEIEEPSSAYVEPVGSKAKQLAASIRGDGKGENEAIDAEVVDHETGEIIEPKDGEYDPFKDNGEAAVEPEGALL